MPDVYYNDHDRHAAAWLRNLIDTALLPAGRVDDRDIQEIRADEVRQFPQAHFFAGIGGWPYALQLAGWDDRPVWTASCPCQPFSTAGKRKGEEDERHLWPVLVRLVAECRPATLLGEQVASRLGREWLARVFADLEALGYAVAAADLPAAGVAAPHRRQRLFWVAKSRGERRERRQGAAQRSQPNRADAGRQESSDGPVGIHEASCRLGDSPSEHDEHFAGRLSAAQREEDGRGGDGPRRTGTACGLGHAASLRERPRADRPSGDGEGRLRLAGAGAGGDTLDGGAARSMGDSHGQREGALGGVPEGARIERPGSPIFWEAFDLLPCRDGKARRVESGTFPLAHGVSGRVGRLRAYGNAIVPQVAATFVRAFLEAEEDLDAP